MLKPNGLVRVIRRNADATRSVRGPVAEEVHAGADIPVLREEDGLVFEHLDVLGEPVGDHDDADGVLRVIEVAKAVERDARFGRRGEGKAFLQRMDLIKVNTEMMTKRIFPKTMGFSNAPSPSALAPKTGTLSGATFPAKIIHKLAAL